MSNANTDRPIERIKGTMPQGIELPEKSVPLLACGPETGCTFTLTDGEQAYVSQDIGDLRDPSSYDVYLESIAWMKEQLGVDPELVVHDMHPDYISSRYADDCGIAESIAVQHHHAHAAACMHENGLRDRVIAVTFDGMGLGDDGTVWGGEFLECDLKSYERKGHLKQYQLPGGDQATLYPERMAFSCLMAEDGLGAEAVSELLKGVGDDDKKLMMTIMEKGVNSPLTSSAGRLFDAVAAMIGFTGAISSPAQAAIGLQAMATEGISDSYSYAINAGELSFGPMFGEILQDMRSGKDQGQISAMFHNTLAEGAVSMCDALRADGGLEDVVLSGGVFYNSLLKGMVIKGLRDIGFNVYSHKLLAPGDVCVSLGQAVVASVKE